MLADRLNRLVALGVARSVPYQEPGDRMRHEYRLTRKGVGLLPVVVALMEWGDEYLRDDDPPVVLRERGPATGSASSSAPATTPSSPTRSCPSCSNFAP